MKYDNEETEILESCEAGSISLEKPSRDEIETIKEAAAARPDKLACTRVLFGILPDNVDLDAAREERLK